MLFTVLGVGGAATWTMTKFGVIGLTKEQAVRTDAPPPQHGLSSNKMALVTSDYGIMRSPSIKWPESPRTVRALVRAPRVE